MGFPSLEVFRSHGDVALRAVGLWCGLGLGLEPKQHNPSQLHVPLLCSF